MGDDLSALEQQAYDEFLNAMADANRATATKDGFMPTRDVALFKQLRDEAIAQYVAALRQLGVEASPALRRVLVNSKKGDCTMPQPPRTTTAKECEQECYDTYLSDLEKAKGAATRHILIIPYTDSDVFEPLAEAAKDKYKRCVERCKGLS